MAKTRNSSSSSSKDLETLLAKANDLFQKTTFDKKQKDFMNTTFLLIKSMTFKVTELIDQNEKLIKDNDSLTDKVTELSKDIAGKEYTIEALEDDVKTLEERVIDSEFKDCKNKVRIDGIKYIESENGFESPEQTCKSFQNLLNDMTIPETKFSECHRVKKSEKTNKPPSIVVKFESSLDQANFFSNLSKLPKTQKVQVSQEFPASLRHKLKRLQTHAWWERQHGYKTVIKRDDSFGLTLFVKKGSAPWSNYFSKKVATSQ